MTLCLVSCGEKCLHTCPARMMKAPAQSAMWAEDEDDRQRPWASDGRRRAQASYGEAVKLGASCMTLGGAYWS